jgi:hypothetical protein
MMIRRAHSVQVLFCDNCNMPHLVLFDENDQAFADAVIGIDIGPQLVEILQDALDGYHEHQAHGRH